MASTHREIILEGGNPYRSSQRSQIEPDVIFREINVRGHSMTLAVPRCPELRSEDQDPRLLEGCLHPTLVKHLIT